MTLLMDRDLPTDTLRRHNADGEQGPRYLWIREQLVKMIIDAGLKGGDPLPPEGQLAKHFGVALGTMRKAIDELVARNVIGRVQGKGLFVASYDAKAALRWFRITNADGSKELPRFERLLSVRVRQSTPNERLRLDLPGDAKVVEMKRTRAFGDGAIMLETIALPADRFPDFKQHLGTQKPVLLYEFYEQHYGVRIVSIASRIRAVPVSSEAAKHMQVEEGVPVLEVERVGFELGSAAVELRTTLCSTDSGRHYFDPVSGALAQ